jgi:polar amino acid transport system substrate-binding protein
MIPKALRLFGLCFAVPLLATPAGAGEVLDRVMSTKTLTLSSDPAYPPQSFMNDQNQMDGFDVDVAKEIAKRFGAEL